MLRDLKQYQAAFESYDRVIALEPTYADVYYNRGNAFNDLRQHRAALDDYQQALVIEPHHADVHWNQSLCYLQMGEFALGWQEYEWRWKTEQFKNAKSYVPKPLWLGAEPLQGKTILLHSEQGLGDTLQFCRYAKQVSALGAHVILEVPQALLKLLAHLEGVDTLLATGQALPAFDYHCPLLSLPLAFKTDLQSIPADIPYIEALAEKSTYWRNKLGPRHKPRVGLVWNGGFRAHQSEVWAINKRRNIELSLIAKLNLSQVDFFSLQKGDPAESEVLRGQDELWPENNFFNYADELKDFSDTAGLIANLDLVISVDTSTAHLAGAMGKPVWILNRFDGCWRWLLDRNDSPWYPTAKLYRQDKVGDWVSVIERVAADLLP